MRNQLLTNCRPECSGEAKQANDKDSGTSASAYNITTLSKRRGWWQYGSSSSNTPLLLLLAGAGRAFASLALPLGVVPGLCALAAAD